MKENKDYPMMVLNFDCPKCKTSVIAQLVEQDDKLGIQYMCNCGKSVHKLPCMSDLDYTTKMRMFDSIEQDIYYMSSRMREKNSSGTITLTEDGKRPILLYEFDKIELCSPYLSISKDKTKVAIKLYKNNKVFKVIFLDILYSFRYYMDDKNNQYQMNIDMGNIFVNILYK